jgi:hypothetical protein
VQVNSVYTILGVLPLLLRKLIAEGIAFCCGLGKVLLQNSNALFGFLHGFLLLLLERGKTALYMVSMPFAFIL